MFKIWTDGLAAGHLDRRGERGSTFVYTPGADPERAVSVTMPVQLASWDTVFGIAPIFEMNLPEGALKERLRLAFAKATGTFDELDLLGVVGRSQMGRVRFTGEDAELDEAVPFQSVDEILSSRRGADLYRFLIEKFAAYSGISGVQPKFLVRDEDALAPEPGMEPGTRRVFSASFRGATHIVKFWDPAEFPQLAANEFFCLKAAERCGLRVSVHRLAEDGSALVMDRFDLRSNGKYRGFEDFCVLNARRTDEKYAGSYETAIMKRFQQFARSPEVALESLELFALIAFNCAIRNGDAHLKNFGIVYDQVEGEAHLAPAYDLVTTTAYIPQDRMALTLNGTNQWPSAKDLVLFGEKRSVGTRQKLLERMERVGDALADTAKDIQAYGKENPEFAPIGRLMVEQWEAGTRESLSRK
jgi:serine/threonine-protein kinase HipA